jgi:hypothetical protein
MSENNPGFWTVLKKMWVSDRHSIVLPVIFFSAIVLSILMILFPVFPVIVFHLIGIVMAGAVVLVLAVFTIDICGEIKEDYMNAKKKLKKEAENAD